MTDVTVVKAIIVVFGSISSLAIAGKLIFLRHVRGKVRHHRHVRRIVTDAVPKNRELFEQYEQPTH